MRVLDKHVFSDNLKYQLQISGYSIRQLADQIQRPASTVLGYLNGLTTDPINLNNIAKAFERRFGDSGPSPAAGRTGRVPRVVASEALGHSRPPDVTGDRESVHPPSRSKVRHRGAVDVRGKHLGDLHLRQPAVSHGWWGGFRPPCHRHDALANRAQHREQVGVRVTSRNLLDRNFHTESDTHARERARRLRRNEKRAQNLSSTAGGRRRRR
jgi:hypothetical protein